jgi:RNA polymerase sigma-70 factor (ECF subfamily)
MANPAERSMLEERAEAPTAAYASLTARFRDGDAAAFEELARPLLDTLYTFCLRVVGNEQEAEDIAQDALVRALLHHRRFDPDRPFRPWLLRITLNVCRDRLRTVWWSRVFSLSHAPVVTVPGPELRVEAAERDAKVRAALATLPRKYREALALFHLNGMGYAEIAEITGTRVPALKQRVRRGLVMLEGAVARMYPELIEGRRSGTSGAEP